MTITAALIAVTLTGTTGCWLLARHRGWLP